MSDDIDTAAPASGAPAVVGVLGGGRMGAGIAHAFLLAGSRVTIVERDAEAAAAAATRVRESVEASIARGVVVGDAATCLLYTSDAADD